MHIAVQGRLRTRASPGHTIRKLAHGNGQRQAPTKSIILSLIRQPHLISHRSRRTSRAPPAKNATQRQIVVERSTVVRNSQDKQPAMQRWCAALLMLKSQLSVNQAKSVTPQRAVAAQYLPLASNWPCARRGSIAILPQGAAEHSLAARHQLLYAKQGTIATPRLAAAKSLAQQIVAS